jgi:MFS family permease
MAGAFLGGLFADAFGYRAAFYGASGLLFLAGMFVVLGTKERFERPEAVPAGALSAAGQSWGPRVSRRVRLVAGNVKGALPVLVLISSIAFARLFDASFLPLLVQDIHGQIKGAATWTGSLAACAGLAGITAGLTIGRLADRLRPATIGKFCALGAGLLMIPQGVAHGFGLLFAARFGMIFFAGGLEPVFHSWLAKNTPQEKRGTVFGWATSARSLGWLMAPLGSGAVAATLGLRWIYFVGPLCFFVLILVIEIATRYPLGFQNNRE